MNKLTELHFKTMAHLYNDTLNDVMSEITELQPIDGDKYLALNFVDNILDIKFDVNSSNEEKGIVPIKNNKLVSKKDVMEFASKIRTGSDDGDVFDIAAEILIKDFDCYVTNRINIFVLEYLKETFKTEEEQQERIEELEEWEDMDMDFSMDEFDLAEDFNFKLPVKEDRVYRDKYDTASYLQDLDAEFREFGFVE